MPQCVLCLIADTNKWWDNQRLISAHQPAHWGDLMGLWQHRVAIPIYTLDRTQHLGIFICKGHYQTHSMVGILGITGGHCTERLAGWFYLMAYLMLPGAGTTGLAMQAEALTQHMAQALIVT